MLNQWIYLSANCAAVRSKSNLQKAAAKLLKALSWLWSLEDSCERLEAEERSVVSLGYKTEAEPVVTSQFQTNRTSFLPQRGPTAPVTTFASNYSNCATEWRLCGLVRER